MLHLAASIDDEGGMAGLILRHAACPGAGALWSTLRDASGQTPADTAYRWLVHWRIHYRRHAMVGMHCVHFYWVACKIAAEVSADWGLSKASVRSL